jgi:hypothetical protein
MIRRLLIPLFTVVILACSLGAPVSGHRDEHEGGVAFRMPQDMNLQPEDVPELSERPVANPSSDLLLPEALGQDQRLYTSQTQDLRIESNLIMLPERTTRAPSELLEEVVRQRRPAAQPANGNEPITVGKFALLWESRALCRSGQGPGLSLVLIRRNAVAVLLGCGSDVTQDYMVRLARSVDSHIAAPADRHEVTWGSHEEGPADADDLATAAAESSGRPPDCSQLALTPQEKANCGTHEYFHQYETTGGGCTAGERNDYGLETHTVVFGQDTVRLRHEGPACKKTDVNTYSCEDEHWTSVVQFGDAGYSVDFQWLEHHDCEHHESHGFGDACGCNGHNEYSLGK